MKHLVLLAIALFSAATMLAEPFYVLVNGKDYYLASPTGTADFQGRTQYAATCVPLKANDVLMCCDKGNNATWAITAIDQGDTWGAPGFTATANGLTCSIAGNYNIYIKLAFEDDVWYVETASDCTAATPDDPNEEVYASSAPAKYPGVMLQAFYWDSKDDKGYGRTRWIDLQNEATELGQWFDLIWLPPSSLSTGGTGYLPKCYSSQSSDWGQKTALQTLVQTFHANGARVVADIVVNHIAGKSGWCDFYQMNFGSFGTFAPNSSWICSTDEGFTGNHCTGTPGAADDGYGSEANYDAARDWDHTNSQVRDMIKAYLKWLRAEIGYDGWRYDYCKGFHNSHINEYNTASQAFFSVMEMWDGNPATLQSHLSDAGWNTLTFDFATKYDVFNNGIAADNYNFRGKGLLGAGKSRYAVTFVDSHDSFQRDNNEFCGLGNSMKYKDKLMQCNAYLLSMPGVPCVFYPHWVTFKDDLKKLINARYKAGVHSESAVSDESGNGYYKATITGTNGSIRLLLGPNSGFASAPSGYTLAAKGTNWGVYYKVNSSIGDKDKNRTPVSSDIEDLLVEEPVHGAEKIIENGQVYILFEGKKYTLLGQPVGQ